MVGKRVQFDEETWAALDLFARESMRDFQELADEAFRDLLAKHERPVGLKDQLKRSQKDDAAPSEPAKPASKAKGRAKAKR